MSNVVSRASECFQFSGNRRHALGVVRRKLSFNDRVNCQVELRAHRLAVFADDLLGQRASFQRFTPLRMIPNGNLPCIILAQLSSLLFFSAMILSSCQIPIAAALQKLTWLGAKPGAKKQSVLGTFHTFLGFFLDKVDDLTALQDVDRRSPLRIDLPGAPRGATSWPTPERLDPGHGLINHRRLPPGRSRFPLDCSRPRPHPKAVPHGALFSARGAGYRVMQLTAHGANPHQSATEGPRVSREAWGSQADASGSTGQRPGVEHNMPQALTNCGASTYNAASRSIPDRIRTTPPLAEDFPFLAPRAAKCAARGAA